MRVWPRSNCRVRVHVTWFSEARVKPRVLGRIASRGVPAPLLRPSSLLVGPFLPTRSRNRLRQVGRVAEIPRPVPQTPLSPSTRGKKSFFFF